MRPARRTTALLLCLVFSAFSLLSSSPALHSHGGSAEALARPASAGARTLPQVALPSGPRDEAPGECLACTFSGLFAVVPSAIPAAAPVTLPQRAPSLDVRAVASPVVAALRGRAPPRA